MLLVVKSTWYECSYVETVTNKCTRRIFFGHGAPSPNRSRGGIPRNPSPGSSIRRRASRVASAPAFASMFKSASAVEKALRALPEAMKPTLVAGKWRAPAFSRRKIAELRRAVLGLDMAWPFEEPPRKEPAVRERKGHKHERTKHLREAKIEAALAKQPELVAAHRERQRAHKTEASAFDRITMSTKELILKHRAGGGGKKGKK